MKNIILTGLLGATFASSLLQSGLAQPWSVTVTNSAPQVRSPEAGGIIPPVITPAPFQPPQQPTPPPAATVGPLPAEILAFDADQKEFNATAGEANGTFTFNATNVSSSEVTIRQIQTSCGCTTANIQLPLKVAPGSTVELPIHMNLQGKSGVIMKTVTIHTDHGQKLLVVKSSILAPAEGMGVNRERNQQLAQADRQAVFKGDCARCHVEPVIGKMGKDLYTFACGICHEAEHRASMVTDLHNLKTPPNAEYWKFFIVNGKPGTLMPAFAQSQGGPLSDAQVASLVDYLVKDFPATKTNAPAHAQAH